jgi:hypothetical protein
VQRIGSVRYLRVDFLQFLEESSTTLWHLGQ